MARYYRSLRTNLNKTHKNPDKTEATQDGLLKPSRPSARARLGKDALLADEPPRILTAAIVSIAVMLSILTAACWSFEYEETVPITLEPGGDAQAGYAIGYLPASVDVNTGQRVRLRHGSIRAATADGEATVTEVSGPTKDGFYVVRVNLPQDAREAVAAGIPEQNAGGQISGELITKKVRLFARLCSVFRNITRGS